MKCTAIDPLATFVNNVSSSSSRHSASPSPAAKGPHKGEQNEVRQQSNVCQVPVEYPSHCKGLKNGIEALQRSNRLLQLLNQMRKNLHPMNHRLAVQDGGPAIITSGQSKYKTMTGV
jgi:hypothetical protein